MRTGYKTLFPIWMKTRKPWRLFLLRRGRVMVSKWKSPSMMDFQITSCPLSIMSVLKTVEPMDLDLKSAITKVMNDYARKDRSSWKDKKPRRFRSRGTSSRSFCPGSWRAPSVCDKTKDKLGSPSGSVQLWMGLWLISWPSSLWKMGNWLLNPIRIISRLVTLVKRHVRRGWEPKW